MIVTPRLQLRPLAAADASPSAALMSEPISRRTGSWPPDISPAEVLERIERAGRSEAGGNGFTRAIERLSDQSLMGWIGVDRIAGQPGEGTIGYWLGEAFWGQGYASEAAAAMLDAAWKRLDLQRVEAGVQPDNLASLAVIRGLGMTAIAPRAAFASARQREELCLYFEIRRPLAST